MNIPTADKLEIENAAASMSVKQNIPFNKAKAILEQEYKRNLRRSTHSSTFDQGEFQDRMDKFINDEAVPN